MGNNSLYNALCQAFTYKKPKLLQSAEIFKERLKVNRRHPVDLMKHIDQLESELKLNINVCGLIERQSNSSHPRQIKLKIFNGHVQHVYKDEQNFKFLYSKYKSYTKWKKRRYPIYFKKNYQDNTIKLWK